MTSNPQETDRNQPRKRRRHGYRGYGSPLGRVREEHGGDFHWGLGFAGLGPTGGGVLPPEPRVVPEGLHESLSPKKS
jgi:hypothetical protein